MNHTDTSTAKTLLYGDNTGAAQFDKVGGKKMMYGGAEPQRLPQALSRI